RRDEAGPRFPSGARRGTTRSVVRPRRDRRRARLSADVHRCRAPAPLLSVRARVDGRRGARTGRAGAARAADLRRPLARLRPVRLYTALFLPGGAAGPAAGPGLPGAQARGADRLARLLGTHLRPGVARDARRCGGALRGLPVRRHLPPERRVVRHRAPRFAVPPAGTRGDPRLPVRAARRTRRSARRRAVGARLLRQADRAHGGGTDRAPRAPHRPAAVRGVRGRARGAGWGRDLAPRPPPRRLVPLLRLRRGARPLARAGPGAPVLDPGPDGAPPDRGPAGRVLPARPAGGPDRGIGPGERDGRGRAADGARFLPRRGRRVPRQQRVAALVPRLLRQRAHAGPRGARDPGGPGLAFERRVGRDRAREAAGVAPALRRTRAV